MTEIYCTAFSVKYFNGSSTSLHSQLLLLPLFRAERDFLINYDFSFFIARVEKVSPARICHSLEPHLIMWRLWMSVFAVVEAFSPAQRETSSCIAHNFDCFCQSLFSGRHRRRCVRSNLALLSTNDKKLTSNFYLSSTVHRLRDGKWWLSEPAACGEGCCRSLFHLPHQRILDWASRPWCERLLLLFHSREYRFEWNILIMLWKKSLCNSYIVLSACHSYACSKLQEITERCSTKSKHWKDRWQVWLSLIRYLQISYLTSLALQSCWGIRSSALNLS